MKEITANNNKIFSAVWQKLSLYWEDKELEMIELEMAHFMETIGITGASLALVRDEKLVYAKGFGKMDDTEDGEPVGPHTMFRIGEVSKAITSATIMTMFERGEFNHYRKGSMFAINIKLFP